MRISDWSSDVGSSDRPYATCRQSVVAKPRARARHRRLGSPQVPQQPLAPVVAQPHGNSRRRTPKVRDPVVLADPQLDLEPCSMSAPRGSWQIRSEEHTSELQSLMRISYAVFCLKQKTQQKTLLLIE